MRQGEKRPGSADVPSAEGGVVRQDLQDRQDRPDNMHEAKPLSECGSLLPLFPRGHQGSAKAATGLRMANPLPMCGTGALAGLVARPGSADVPSAEGGVVRQDSQDRQGGPDNMHEAKPLLDCGSLLPLFPATRLPGRTRADRPGPGHCAKAAASRRTPWPPAAACGKRSERPADVWDRRPRWSLPGRDPRITSSASPSSPAMVVARAGSPLRGRGPWSRLSRGRTARAGRARAQAAGWCWAERV